MTLGPSPLRKLYTTAMTTTANPDVTPRDEAEVRRVAAVRRFKADQGKFPGMMETHRATKLAELAADARAEDAAGRIRAAQEPAAVEL